MMLLRRYITLALATVILFTAAVPGKAAETKTSKSTEWGWPLPYEKVSEKSIKWLKEQGWWPLQYGYSATWAAQWAVPLIVKEKGLAQARGLEVELKSFLAGPPMNEGLIAGRLQISSGGDLPITSLIVRKAPVRSVGIIWTPVMEQQILVPVDSPIRKPADLKGKTIGLVSGSSSEFAMVTYGKAHGLQAGKDFIIKPTPIPDQIALPAGIDAVLPWTPTPRLMWKYRKNARIFDDTGPYILGWGGLHVREELTREAPDVVQAITDMAIEAVMWARLNPKETLDIMTKEPALKAYPPELIYDENIIWMSNLKPTSFYPFVEVYAASAAKTAKWLHDGGRLKDPVPESRYFDYFKGAPELVNQTFQKLGWKIPKEPPYFPKGVTIATFKEWVRTGERFNLIWPYKLEKPQPWPEPEDLDKPWYYGGRLYSPKGH